jgi:pyruvate carboxylase
MKLWSKLIKFSNKKIDLKYFSIEIERGKVLHIVVLAISELMVETGEREVFFQVNGQLRSMKVKDKVAIKDQKVHPKVDKSNKNQIGK